MVEEAARLAEELVIIGCGGPGTSERTAWIPAASATGTPPTSRKCTMAAMRTRAGSSARPKLSQNLEGDATLDVGEGRAVKVEAHSLRGAKPGVREPDKARPRVDVALNEPGRGQAIPPRGGGGLPDSPLKVGAGQPADPARHVQRFAGGPRLQYRQGFLDLPLGLSRKEVDGGQGRELPPQGAYGLGHGGIRRLNRLEESGVVSLAIKEGHEVLPLAFIPAIEAVNSGGALHAFHVFGNGLQCLRVEQ